MRATSLRGAAAGVIAAAAWAASEPAVRRLARTPYSDVRLLGRAVTRGRGWPVAGAALHLVNGALFGATFSRLGLRGLRAGIVAAELESLALWPAFGVVDRVHPDRRDDTWPPLLRNPRVAVYEVVVHALFGAVLGVLTEATAASRSSRSRSAARYRG